MGPGGWIRELQEGHVPAIRTGMLALIFGAFVTVSVLFLLSPSMDGMVGIGRHELDGPAPEPIVHRVVAPPPLTKAQRATARRTAVRVAATQIGVRERNRDNRGTTITAYRRAVTGPGERPTAAEPWCADFVSWAWRRAGVPIGFNGRGSDYVPELVAWARLTRRWHWARDGYRPQPGDLIVFRSAASMRGHIGLVSNVKGGMLSTIEGNYGDKVSRRLIRPWSPVVTGYISPV